MLKLLPPTNGESRRTSAFIVSLLLHAGAVYAFNAVSPFLFSSELPIARDLREEVRTRKWRVVYVPRLPDITPAKEIGRAKEPQAREHNPSQVMISNLQRSRAHLQTPKGSQQQPARQARQTPPAPPKSRPSPAPPASAESAVAANQTPRPIPKPYVVTPAVPRPQPPVVLPVENIEINTTKEPAPLVSGISQKFPGKPYTVRQSTPAAPAPVLLPVENIEIATTREPALPVAGISQKFPGKPYTVRQGTQTASAPALIPVENIELAQGGGAPGLPGAAGVSIGINQKLPAKPYVPGGGTGSSSGSGSDPAGGTGNIIGEPAPNLGAGGNGSLAEGIAIGAAGDITGLPSMSRAPKVGPTASGPVDGAGGVRMAGVMIRDRRVPALKEQEPPKGKQYIHEATGTAINSLSLPLRPTARILPPAIERTFKGRVMYTAVIPKPALPTYTGDWILWFGERDAQSGTVPQMRAPIPISKSMNEPQEDAQGVEHRFQILASIAPDGSVQVRSLLRGASHPMASAVLKDLKLWTFKPALREGVPVEVDIVFEIPMRVSQRVPSGGSEP